MRPIFNRIWRRPLGPKRDLHVDALYFWPTWRPRWIWEVLDVLIDPVWDDVTAPPPPFMLGLRALEHTRLGPAVGHAFAGVRLLSQAFGFLLPSSVSVPSLGLRGVRWLGVTIYTTRKP